MTSRFALCTLLALASACAAHRTTGARPEKAPLRAGLSVRALAPETWVVTQDEAHSSNVLVARFSDGTVLLCSSPFDTDATRALLAWVRRELAPKRIVAINTHWHLDGTGGNEAYREAGVEVWSSAHTRALLLERGERLRSEAAEGLAPDVAAHVRATAIVGAENVFEEAAGRGWAFGGERVEVRFPGAAHAPDNVVVSIPSRALVFGGCMLKIGDSLGYLGDASLPTWEAALDVVAAFAPKLVVPGHGAPGGAEIIDNTRRLVRAAVSSR
ncbi:MAG: MBL fold metallo-hydrolase [Myxococcaceae bacterium]